MGGMKILAERIEEMSKVEKERAKKKLTKENFRIQ